MRQVGKVEQLVRYPVKSMAGELLSAAEVSRRGLLGDRVWAVRDEAGGTITGGKRLPVLMKCSARFLEPPRRTAERTSPPVSITFPDGSALTSDAPEIHARLSDLVGRKVTLCPLHASSDRRHYRAPRLALAEMRRMFGVGEGEALPDFSMFPLSKLGQLTLFATPPGTYFDAYPLHVLTTASLRAMKALAPDADFDARRFRPNVLIDSAEPGLAEVGWCEHELALGEVRIAVGIPTVRCSMPSRPQRDLGADTGVVKALAAHAERCIGVYAEVTRGGTVEVGAPVELGPPGASAPSRLTGVPRAMKRLLLRAVAAVLPEG
jgi:uncharacterized protein YcbX